MIRLEAGAEGHRQLVARQALLIVGVAIFAADIGLAAISASWPPAPRRIAVEILGEAVDAVGRLEAGVGVAALDVEVGGRADRDADAAAGIEVAAGLDLGDIVIAFLLGRFRGLDIGAKGNAVATAKS